ncbi:ABC transporter permease, partial [Sinorhizobium meliloti]
FGARNTIGISLAATMITFVVGVSLGITAAVLGGVVDMLMSRIVDAIMALPQLVVILVMLSVVGSSVFNLIVLIGIAGATNVFRLARSVSLNVTVMDYVEDARVRGESLVWIVFREVLPNILPTLVAEFGMRFCFVVLTISALSFLGLGIQPPTADWGSMVRESATLISYGDVTPLLPAAAIAFLAIGVNFVVDWFLNYANGLRDDH